MAKIKKGDLVQVITGATQERGGDRGKQGKVLDVLADKNRVIVEGVNMVTRHQKARNAMQPGGIVKKEAAIDASNVMLICPKCGKPTRVSHKVNVAVDANGKKNRTMVRVCKKCGADID